MRSRQGMDRIMALEQRVGAGATSPLKRAEHDVVGLGSALVTQERLIFEGNPYRRQDLAHGAEVWIPGLVQGVETSPVAGLARAP